MLVDKQKTQQQKGHYKNDIFKSNFARCGVRTHAILRL